MTTKQQAIHAIEELPEDATWEDIQDRIHFIAGVRKAIRELDEGKCIPHDQIKQEIAAWPAN